jgi:hypothetical protein
MSFEYYDGVAMLKQNNYYGVKTPLHRLFVTFWHHIVPICEETGMINHYRIINLLPVAFLPGCSKST